jgi:imidazolonepropionase-like amidohydrolase
VIDVHTESFRRAVEAGVKVAMGTDCPVSPHGTNLGELELMAKLSDMTPVDALVATTRSGAELMGLADELGTLEPGKRADVVVVDGDPLDLATLSDRIDQVWKDGVKVV